MFRARKNPATTEPDVVKVLVHELSMSDSSFRLHSLVKVSHSYEVINNSLF
jgi:hypothetical protein